jgi:hypothetical protein
MNTQRYYGGDQVFDLARSWKFRVALAAFPADPMGLIVRAVLGMNSAKGAALGLEATIRPDGIVTAKLRSFNGRILNNAHPLGSIIALRDDFRRLADHCKLNDGDRMALFEELRKWCGKDLRSRSS